MHPLTALGLWFAVLAVSFAPAVCATAWLLWTRRRNTRRSPLTGGLRNLPGESTAHAAETLYERAGDRLMLSVIIGPLVLAVWAIMRLDLRAVHFGVIEGVFVVGAVLVSVFATRSAMKLTAARRHYLDGQAAERATAQALSPLVSKGCAIYNDVPAAGFNLDHVVVGPDRVYVIETKSRRKPAKRSAENAQARFDGHALQFPGWSETRPLDQARAEARWLAERLYRKTGERVHVDPVVALPGWYVTRSVPSSDVHVINPNMHRFMAECKGTPMLEPQRRRIMTAIEECYAGA